MSNGHSDDFLLVGRITAPFGVRGELKITLISSRPEHLGKLKRIYVGEGYQAYDVERLHEHKANTYILRLRDVTTRDQSDTLRGSELYIRASDAAPLADDEYFLHDLVGLKVRTAAGEDVGRVVELIETGANEVLVVREIGRADLLVPMLRSIVTRIDVANGLIEITDLDSVIPQ